MKYNYSLRRDSMSEKKPINIKLDLTPFICEAFGYNTKIYKEIDNLYQNDKYKFYNSAKNHPLYNHKILTEGNLLQEEYAKKTLGILLNLDDKVTEELVRIIKKGWHYSYIMALNSPKVDLEKFLNNFVKKHKGLENISDDELNTSLIITILLANSLDKEIVDNEFLAYILNNISERWLHYQKKYGPSGDSYIYDIRPEEQQKIKNLKDKIYAEKGLIKDLAHTTSLSKMRDFSDRVSLLFDFEGLSTVSLMNDIKLKPRDIDEILLVYILENKDKVNIDEASKHLIFGMYIKYLLKAYKKVKKHYFENNKETMFVELEHIEKQAEELSEKLSVKERKIAEMQELIELQEKEIARLKEELKTERENRQELNSLREFIFKLDNRAYVDEEKAIDYTVFDNGNFVIVGGHENWQNKLKQALPAFKFININNANFDTSIIKNADIVFIYTDYLNHGIYYRVISAMKDSDVKIHYLKQQNERLLLAEIEKAIKEL